MTDGTDKRDHRPAHNFVLIFFPVRLSTVLAAKCPFLSAGYLCDGIAALFTMYPCRLQQRSRLFQTASPAIGFDCIDGYIKTLCNCGITGAAIAHFSDLLFLRFIHGCNLLKSQSKETGGFLAPYAKKPTDSPKRNPWACG